MQTNLDRSKTSENELGELYKVAQPIIDMLKSKGFAKPTLAVAVGYALSPGFQVVRQHNLEQRIHELELENSSLRQQIAEFLSVGDESVEFDQESANVDVSEFSEFYF